MQPETCPRCGERQGFLPVQRTQLTGNRRYERYFCCHCRSVFERGVDGGGASPLQPIHRAM